MSGKSDLTGMMLAEHVAEIAARKHHGLAAYMTDGKHPLSVLQAEGIMRYLRRCPDLGTVREEDMGRARTRADVEAVNRLTISDIPAGFFATESRTGNNDYDFWKVTVVQDGPYKGYRKAKRVVGGGDARTPRLIEISKQEQRAALGAILRTGIRKAQEDYADKEERCMKCGRQLTDETSRQQRMGDWCAGKE